MHRFLTLCFALAMCDYISNLSKMIYEEPRPFWVDPLIKTNICHKGFGNPSGHSLSSAAVWTLLGIQLAHSRFYRREPVYEPFWMGVGIKKAVVIATTRFVLGAHSLNQIIFGFSLGLWICFFSLNIVQPAFKLALKRNFTWDDPGYTRQIAICLTSLVLLFIVTSSVY